MIAAGCDVGSLTAKAYIMTEKGPLASEIIRVKSTNISSANEVMEKALASARLRFSDLECCCSTGYGRHEIPFAKMNMSEISCHGLGAFHADPSIRTVIDIGGQDCKVILIDSNGSIRDFIMNDKCAAGTGRFLQMMAHVLDYDIGDFGSVDPWGEFQPISSMCAVFAETEVVGHLARGVDRESLVRGLLRSIASRSAAMLARIGMKEPLFFSGGVSRSPSLVRLIGRETDCEILTSDRSQFAGAIGAALIGWEDEERDGNHT